ncbi:hypothetical protein EJ110_NYTH37708 [Nymphaea thermarum]|nr:hypothetical protein EJ110_NYTH37708 [Nymphaea thermarum]
MVFTKGKEKGIISLNYGAPDGASYKSDVGLFYTSNSSYISSGVAKQISSNYLTSSPQIYQTVRSFSQYTRNCSSLGPWTSGSKYIVRASFMHGNYDGLSSVPNFDLYMGMDLWNTIRLDNATHRCDQNPHNHYLTVGTLSSELLRNFLNLNASYADMAVIGVHEFGIPKDNKFTSEDVDVRPAVGGPFEEAKVQGCPF